MCTYVDHPGNPCAIVWCKLIYANDDNDTAARIEKIRIKP